MSEDNPKVDREGIHIDREVAERIHIEEELDSNVEGEYLFPSPMRRRISAWVYLVAAVAVTFAFPEGWMVAVGLGVIALWHFASAWPLAVDEHQAMTSAAAVVPFPVGHASASVRFRGWRSRPRWSVVMYSASEPPDQRALVVIDAVNGEVAETPYVETISEV